MENLLGGNNPLYVGRSKNIPQSKGYNLVLVRAITFVTGFRYTMLETIQHNPMSEEVGYAHVYAAYFFKYFM